MRTLEVAPSRSKVGLLHERSASSRADAPTGMPRPSWSVLIVATAVVAGLTWGIARQRTNVIDPRQVIAVNLSAAKLAIEDARLVEPAEHSAAYYYRMVLAIDPTNEAAHTGLNAVAEELLTVAKSAILSGRFADAVEAVDHTRRIAPEHRRIPFVETELRKALDAHAASVTHPRESQLESASQPSTAERDTTDTTKETQHLNERKSTVLADASEPSAGSAPEASAESPEPRSIATLATRSVPTQALRDRQYVAIDTSYQLARSALDVSAAPIASEPASPPITVSAERVAPKIVALVEPEYPKAARVRGIEGWVDLTLSVAATGNVVDARVDDSKGTKSFERAALSAVRQWRYETTSRTTTQDVPVRVEFRLER